MRLHLGKPLIRSLLTDLIRGASQEFSRDDIKAMIESEQVPELLVDCLADGIAAAWQKLQGAEESDVESALREALPESVDMLMSAQGRQWIDQLVGRVRSLIPFRLVLNGLGGGIWR